MESEHEDTRGDRTTELDLDRQMDKQTGWSLSKSF